jgi:modulator of FtsH protease HflK
MLRIEMAEPDKSPYLSQSWTKSGPQSNLRGPDHMPWSNQSGGGSGGGGSGGDGGGGWKGGGPWGQGSGGRGGGSGGGGGGKNQQPDLEEILKRGQDKIKQALPGGGLPGPAILLIGAVAVALAGFYAFAFTVKPDELGVVLRLGKYHHLATPGLNFRLPRPFEEVRVEQVTKQRTIEVGNTRGGRGPSTDAALMLTGDGNVANVPFTVFWRIKPDQVKEYVFNIQNPEQTVREVADSAMREVVGQSVLQPLLTSGRQDVQVAVQKLMQEILDFYGAGVRVDQVVLGEVDAPSPVVESFRDVAAADQDRQTYQKQAQTYADQIVPQANGDAQRIIAAAQGFKEQTIAEATGQAARFIKVYEEYKKAPEVTRQRLFLEMQERVLSGTDKIIIDSRGGQGVTPFLPLDQIQTKKKPEGSN